MMNFGLGDFVMWTSGNGRGVSTKRGVIEHVLPAGKYPSECGIAKRFDERCLRRKHEHYIVRVGDKFYWPLVSKLSVDLEAASAAHDRRVAS